MLKKLLFTSALYSACASPFAGAETEAAAFHKIPEARTDRYTIVKAGPTEDQKSPLKALINVTMGKDISTVGDAINEVLLGSGYRWIVHDNGGSADRLLNSLPLPSIVRNIGPMQLDDALQTLAGEAWTLKTDYLNRVVWFEIKNDSLAMTNSVPQ